MSHRMSGAEHGLSGKAPTMTDRQETQLNVAPTPPGFTISRTGMRGTVSPGLGDAIEGSVSVQHSAPLSLVSSWPRGSYRHPPPSSFHSPGLETTLASCVSFQERRSFSQELLPPAHFLSRVTGQNYTRAFARPLLGKALQTTMLFSPVMVLS